MWILSSLGRPDRIRAVVDAYHWGGESNVALVLYEGDRRIAEYFNQKWPKNWTIHTVGMEGNGPTYNEIFERFPRERTYGFLADDAVLDVQGMLRILEIEAGEWNVAYANDKFHGAAIPTMPCMGGELVRAVGYLAPHCLMHMAIDCAWHEIGQRLDALRYCETLTYTHLHPLLGTAKEDRTYQLARRNSVDYERLFRGWVMGGELDAAVARAKSARLKEAA